MGRSGDLPYPLPAHSERYGNIIHTRAAVGSEAVIPPCFGIKLGMPFGSHGDAGSDICAGLIHGIRAEDFLALIKTKEAWDERGRCQILILVIEAASADDVGGRRA